MAESKKDAGTKSKQNKVRLLKMLDYFYKKTDDEHKIATNDLVELASTWDTHANRKTVKDDIDALIDGGYDIVTSRSYYNSFFMGEREFELPELKLLIDAVSSSQGISAKKSKILIQKLMGLASEYQAEELVRHIYTPDYKKPANESIYYVVDDINAAINGGFKIRFQYYDYTVEKKKVLAHNGKRYVVSPYCLIWENDHYYMIGLPEENEESPNLPSEKRFRHYRVDRMCQSRVLQDTPWVSPEESEFQINDYANKLFDMFGGTTKEVTLEVENELMKSMIDKFGEDVKTRKWSSHSFRLTAEVSVSPTFYGWVFQWGGKVKIISPMDVADEYLTMVWQVMQGAR